MGNTVRAVSSIAKKYTPAGLAGLYGADKGPGQAVLNSSPFDIKNEAKKYEDLYTQQRQQAEARTAAANTPALIAQLSQQAMGQGPSLAEAQLKSATNRNLAQQLAAAASMRGRNPAATQRQVLNMQGDAGRQLAEQSSVARLQEQQQAMSQLAQQQQMADSLQQNSTQQGFAAAVAPKQSMQAFEQTRFAADNAARQAEAQRQAQQQAAILGTIGTIGGAAIGGPAGAKAGGSIGGSFAAQGSVPQSGPGPHIMASEGGEVPGKPAVKGNSPKNDFMHALVSPGEIIIPRSHASSPKKASAFVEQLFANKMNQGGMVKAKKDC